jgi:hypothetical protein
LRRTECEFLVLFSDAEGDTTKALWRPWAADLDQTVAYEDFLRTRPELQLLLGDAKSQDKRLARLRKMPITFALGTSCYVDLRSWSESWYTQLNLPNAYITRYLVHGVYGKIKSMRGKYVIDLTFPVLDESYTNMDSQFVQLWGQYLQLPNDAVLVDHHLVLEYPAIIQESKREHLMEKYKRIVASLPTEM